MQSSLKIIADKLNKELKKVELNLSLSDEAKQKAKEVIKNIEKTVISELRKYIDDGK